MDKHFFAPKSLTALQPKVGKSWPLVGNLQNEKGLAARDIRNLSVPGAFNDTGLKVLLSKAANQGLLELNGANYMVKGHAKTGQSKARSQSVQKKGLGKKASKSKGSKKSAGSKKSKSAGPKKSKSSGSKKAKSADPKKSKSARPKKSKSPGSKKAKSAIPKKGEEPNI